MLPTGKNHISYSEIKDWNQCSYRHKLKYIDQVNLGVPNIHASFGTSIHEACENFLKTKEMDLSIFENTLKKIWEENKEVKEFTQENYNISYEDGINILNEIPTFIEATFGSDWELVEAEKELLVEINTNQENSPNFKGYIDGILKVKDKKGNEQYWILDWKTTSFGWKPQKKQDPEVRMQLALYKKYWSKISNIDLKNIKCAFILLKRKYSKGKKCELYTVSIGETPINSSEIIIKNMLHAVNKGIAIKNKFSCQYCDYYMTNYCK